MKTIEGTQYDGKSLLVWSGGIERAHMSLNSGDIKEALAWFKNKTGKEAKLIILNPKNEHLAYETNGVKVDYLGGCLTWEVWLSAKDNLDTRQSKFDIKRDNEYPFFCQACLVGKPLSERSAKDTRYCVECQRIIEYEYSMLADKGAWKKYKPVPDATLVAFSGAIESQPLSQDTHRGKMKMSTINENTAIGDKLEVSPSKSRLWKGRPKTYKKKELPEEVIKQLSREGVGLKTIASKLKEQGIEVSYRTIGRVLSGERTA